MTKLEHPPENLTPDVEVEAEKEKKGWGFPPEDEEEFLKAEREPNFGELEQRLQNKEDNKVGKNKQEVVSETGAQSPEKEPTLRELGRARIERIGSFFSNIKEGFKNKVRLAGGAISGAMGRAREIGVAGLETVMAAPEAVRRGVEYGVGAAEMAYKKGRETVISAKDKVIEAKNAVLQKGRSAVEWGLNTVVEAKDATVEFGNRALYHAAERVSRPFLKFQISRIKQSIGHLMKGVENGKIKNFEKYEKLYEQLKGLQAL